MEAIIFIGIQASGKTLRNRIRAEMELPTREAYGAFIERLVAASLKEGATAKPS